MRTTLTIASLLLWLAACEPRNTTYNLRSAALPPPPRPVAQSNLPMKGQFQVFADSSALVSLKAPEDGSKEVQHGIRVPKIAAATGIRWKRTEHFDMSFLFDYGSHASADRVEGDKLPPTGDYWGLGGGLNIHMGEANSDMRVSAHVSMSLYTVPYVRDELRGDGTLLERTESSDTDPVYRIGLTPSFRLSDTLVAYGSVRLASHLTTIGDGPYTTTDGVPSPVITDSVDTSVSAGLDADLGEGLRLGVYIHQTSLSGDIRYWPTMGLNLAYEWSEIDPSTQPLFRPAPTSPYPRQ